MSMNSATRFVVSLLTLSLFSAPGFGTAQARTITVTAPHLDMAVDGECSLSEAVTAVNESTATNECPAGEAGVTDTIEFNLSSGHPQIHDTYYVPAITSPVIIDGTTQPGTSCTDGPHLHLRNTNPPGDGGISLRLGAGSDGSTIKGLRFTGNFICLNFGICISAGALRVEETSNISIQCNAFGSDNFGNTYPLIYYTNLIDIRVREGSSNIVIGSDGDGVDDDLEGNWLESETGISVSNSQNIRISGNRFNDLVRDNGGGATVFTSQQVILGNDPTNPVPHQGNVFHGGSNIYLGGPGLANVGIFGNWLGVNPDGTDASGSGGIHISQGEQIQIGLWDPSSSPEYPLSNRILDLSSGVTTTNFPDRFVSARIEGNLFMAPQAGRNGALPTRGLYITGSAAFIAIQHNAFRGLDAALHVIAGAVVSDSEASNCFDGNGFGAIQEANSLSNVPNNWWGAPDGPNVNGVGSGDAVSGNVNVLPYLNAPPQSCALIPNRFGEPATIPVLSRFGFCLLVLIFALCGTITLVKRQQS